MSDNEIADFLNALPKPVRKAKVKRVVVETKHDYKARLIEARKVWYQRENPEGWKDGHYFDGDIPDVNTTNGMQRYIVKFVDYIGGIGNRINVMGREIGKEFEKLESGETYDSRKMIGSSTKTGTADLDLQIPHPKHFFGIHVYAEAKRGKDTQGKAQYKFMNKVNGTGGIYVIIKSVDQWFDFYDNLVKFAYTK